MSNFFRIFITKNYSNRFIFAFSASMLLGGRKGIRPVKTEWSGAGMVVCLERGAFHAIGWQEGHPACKNWVVGCWHGRLSGARCRLAYGPANATVTRCLLLQWNPDWFYLLVPVHLGSTGQGPLNGCTSFLTELLKKWGTFFWECSMVWYEAVILVVYESYDETKTQISVETCLSLVVNNYPVLSTGACSTDLNCWCYFIISAMQKCQLAVSL